MEIAYLHLVTNHIPIIGIPFAIALLVSAIWRKSDELKLFSFLAFIVIALGTIAVYLLGQGGEDFVEDLTGVSHDAIEDHEEMATLALISVLVVAAVSAFALIRYRLLNRGADDTGGSHSTFPRWITILVLALALGSAAVLGYTGRLGGKIRHTEFHGGDAGAEADRDGSETEEEGGGRGRRRNRGGR